MLKPKYISLKKAAEISNYSADYIGHLIREGKISGRPIYTNITWQTTAEEILNYKNRGVKEKKKIGVKKRFFSKFLNIREALIREIKIIKVFVKTFKFVLPLIFILILTFSLAIGFIFSTQFKSARPWQSAEEIPTQENIDPNQPLIY
jgi:hypothetical protein